MGYCKIEQNSLQLGGSFRNIAADIAWYGKIIMERGWDILATGCGVKYEKIK
jgi:hypothetical protein